LQNGNEKWRLKYARTKKPVLDHFFTTGISLNPYLLRRVTSMRAVLLSRFCAGKPVLHRFLKNSPGYRYVCYFSGWTCEGEFRIIFPIDPDRSLSIAIPESFLKRIIVIMPPGSGPVSQITMDGIHPMI
jgi:hypothetical protein